MHTIFTTKLVHTFFVCVGINEQDLLVQRVKEKGMELGQRIYLSIIDTAMLNALFPLPSSFFLEKY